MMNLEPVIVTDYGIVENRASVSFGEGALVYNKKEDSVHPQLDLFQKLEDHEELITHGHPSHGEMVNKLNSQHNLMFQQAIAKAVENTKNA